MIKAVIFDMFETLVTHYRNETYFGENIANDLNLSEGRFRNIWDASDDDRTLGKSTFEETISEIMHANDIYDEELLKKVVRKRRECKEKIFTTYGKEIPDMLDALKEKGLKIALISNCFDEEVGPIKNSRLYPYFDVALLSYEVGIMKPDPEIFKLALKKLKLAPDECIYVGDGGSHELEAATACGMKAYQARWYLKENTRRPPRIFDDYTALYKPEDVLKYIR
jgi:putative hydrolase of the HAD superfamily